MKYTVHLYNAQQAVPALRGLFEQIKPHLLSGWRLKVTAEQETRSTEQNSRLWAMLGEISRQVEWYGKRLSPEDWKHIFSASLRKLSVVPNLDGTGFVALGMSTSRMTKGELSELMQLIEAFGAERGVKFAEEQAA